MNWQAVIDGTWPAARVVTGAGWTLRITPGAGGRVNALSGAGAIADAEALAAENGTTPNFIVWPEAHALDDALAARGYAVADAVHIWRGDCAALGGDRLPHATAFAVWPPLAIMRELWAEGGIGPERQAVMARAPRGTGILGRARDRTAGLAFVSVHEATAMLHALHVAPRYRRQGVARLIVRAAAHWARASGAETLSLVVTRTNSANALYASMGMERVAGYHYRRKAEAP